MKTPSKLLLFFLLIPALFIGCGQSDAPTPVEAKPQNNMRALYSQVAGIYRGYINSSSRNGDDFPIEVKLYLVDTPIRQIERSTGQVDTNPALKAYYRRLDADTTTAYTLLVAYNADSGQLDLSNRTISLHGNYSAGVITGNSQIDSFPGTFEIRRISQDE